MLKVDAKSLLVTSKKDYRKIERKGIAIRLDAKKIDLFRKLCKEHNLYQTAIFENALDLVIEELTKKDK
jgi:uncharacterized protein YjaG (DUF416 family)